MPLVILSGYPSSGISSRAQELEADLKQRGLPVVVVTDASLGIAKSAYADRELEKAARGAQFGAVQRHLTKETVVILDNMSYIKGFRYQLFCEAKAFQTTACVIHVGTSEEKCKEWNSRENGWDPELLKALMFRYEEPNSMNRWDSPLFIVLPEEKLPCDEIYGVLFENKPLRPNAATILKPAAQGDYLSLLNQRTATITKQVMDLHKDAPGSTVTVEGHSVTLPYRLTLPQVSRIKRNFIQLNKATNLSEASLDSFFIEFLQRNWDIES